MHVRRNGIDNSIIEQRSQACTWINECNMVVSERRHVAGTNNRLAALSFLRVQSFTRAAQDNGCMECPPMPSARHIFSLAGRRAASRRSLRTTRFRDQRIRCTCTCVRWWICDDLRGKRAMYFSWCRRVIHQAVAHVALHAHGAWATKSATKGADFRSQWRPGSESNRRTRLCRPLHDHSATWPLR